MTSPSDIKFLSQKIMGASGDAPLLLPSHNSNRHGNNNKRSEVAVMRLEHGRSTTSISKTSNNKTINLQVNHETFSWGLRIDVTLIPRLPMYYILEPKSTMTVQDIPVTLVESRLSDFMRLYSISYSFHADSMHLDCGTSGMLKFTVQFWLVSQDQQQQQQQHQSGDDAAVTLELQRRQGSVIEMQKIRREMFQFIMTGEQPKVSSERHQSWQPPRAVLVDAKMSYDPEESRKDAVRISLQLLESSAIDQMKLGLESLMMLTNPSVVSREDAVVISQEIVFQTSDVGRRLQTALALCFGIASTGRPMVADDDRAECIRGAYFEQLHNMGLKILCHALQLAVEDPQYPTGATSTFDLASDFWSLVTRDLFHNVERAVQRPHEASMSAKCMRLLSTLKGQVHATLPSEVDLGPSRPVAFHSCLTQAHQYGKRCHLSLETESQKLLAMDVDHALVSH